MTRLLTLAAGIIFIVLWLVLRTWGRIGRIEDSTAKLMMYSMLQALARFGGLVCFWAGVAVFIHLFLSR